MGELPMRVVDVLAVSVALLVSATFPAVAQDHLTHNSNAAPPAHGATTGGLHVGTATSSSNTGPHRGNHSGHARNRNDYGYGYGYPYGAPIELPYDSEYNQLEGRGTLDHPQAPEGSEIRVGPTIFEHNGQPTDAVAGSRSGAPISRESADHNGRASLGPLGPAVAVVLIFRDGHQQEVSNYAIAGSHLIVVGEKTQKILLSDLDQKATSKANADRGIDFKMPNPS
jgi:hypothetical protein